MEHVWNGVSLTKDQIENHRFRHEAVLSILTQEAVSRVMEIGCSEGRFLAHLAQSGMCQEIVGIDINEKQVAFAKQNLAEFIKQGNVEVFHGSIERHAAQPGDWEAIVLIETIEHLVAGDLGALEERVFGFLQPRIVIVTTPLAEPRHTREQMDAVGHVFEWNREELAEWAGGLGERYGYQTDFSILSGPTFKRGTQIAVFKRSAL